MTIEEEKPIDQLKESNQQKISPQVTHIDNWLEDERPRDLSNKPKRNNKYKQHTQATKRNTYDNNTTSQQHNLNTRMHTEPPPPGTATPAYIILRAYPQHLWRPLATAEKEKC